MNQKLLPSTIMKKVQRKLSPHVTIYGFPLTAISSITNRLTGLYLTGLFVGCGIYNLVPDPFKARTLTEHWKQMEPSYQKVFHYSIIAPTIYHTFGGLRHFLWEYQPKYLSNKFGKFSSLFLFGATILCTIGTEEYILYKKKDICNKNEKSNVEANDTPKKIDETSNV